MVKQKSFVVPISSRSRTDCYSVNEKTLNNLNHYIHQTQKANVRSYQSVLSNFNSTNAHIYHKCIRRSFSHRFNLVRSFCGSCEHSQHLCIYYIWTMCSKWQTYALITWSLYAKLRDYDAMLRCHFSTGLVACYIAFDLANGEAETVLASDVKLKDMFLLFLRKSFGIRIISWYFRFK